MHVAPYLPVSVLLLAAAFNDAVLSAEAPYRAERAQRVFSVHDTNADGYLSRAEYDLLLQRRRQRQAAAGRPLGTAPAPAVFDQVDTDSDQRISLQELSSVLGQRLRLRHRHGLGDHPPSP